MQSYCNFCRGNSNYENSGPGLKNKMKLDYKMSQKPKCKMQNYKATIRKNIGEKSMWNEVEAVLDTTSKT